MKNFKYVVTNPKGLTASIADKLITELEDYSSEVRITKKNKSGNARIVFNLFEFIYQKWR